MDPENRLTDRMIQGVTHNIPKIFQIVRCLTSHFGWKFHDNQVNRFLATLLTENQPTEMKT